MLSTVTNGLLRLLFPLYAIAGLVGVVILMGTPISSRTTKANLQRIGLVNHAGEVPALISKRKDKANPRVSVWEFDACGIPLKEWEDKRQRIEAALNMNIVKMVWGKDKRRVLLYAATAETELEKTIYWHDKYLSADSFNLVLGESLLGPVTVDLAKVPHILLGGSTGSGKSVLLKLLLMQAVKKGALVCIADFKGGVDFPDVWHRRCRMVFDENSLLGLLSGLVDELEQRKTIFREAGYPNLDEYNAATKAGLKRMIFACDEVAEVLDKTGRGKEDKEIIGQIESKLSVIARQGRAFGVHLILATQRPDATILAGQIRNNIDCRVCGRADNVLSQIILDSTAAAEQIPKDAQGRFITGDGIVFQGYLFDEDSL